MHLLNTIINIPSCGHPQRETPETRYEFLIIKPTRCTNFSNLFLEWNSTCFGQFHRPSSGVFHCTHSKPVWHIPLLCVQWKTPDDGPRNCPKHVQFHSKKKFEKLVHLVGFIIRNLTRCMVTWTSNKIWDWDASLKSECFLTNHKLRGSFLLVLLAWCRH